MATDARITSPRTAQATPTVAAFEPSPLAYEHLARNIANLTTEGAQLRVLWKDARTAVEWDAALQGFVVQTGGRA